MNTVDIAESQALAPSNKTIPSSVAIEAGSRASGPDILRSLAILLVMMVHLPIEATPGALMGVRSYGWIGVDIFFVLSGYLIGTQLLGEVKRYGRVDLKSFYLRRAFRILPAFFVVLGIYTFFPILRDAPTMQSAWRFATFTVNFGLDPRYGGTFTEAWSLSVEEHFYLVLPVLVLFLLKRVTLVSVLALAASLLMVGAVLRFTIWQSEVGVYTDVQEYRQAFASYLREIYYPTYNRLDGLMCGVLLAAARLFRPDLWKRYVPARIALGVGAILVVAALLAFSYRGAFAGTDLPLVAQSLMGSVVGFPLLSAGVALILSGMLDLDPVLGRWRLPGAVAVATLSYSLYLTHKGVYHLDKMVFGKENLLGLSGFVIYFATCFIVAATLWFLVERTSLRLRDHFVPRSR